MVMVACVLAMEYRAISLRPGPILMQPIALVTAFLVMLVQESSPILFFGKQKQMPYSSLPIHCLLAAATILNRWKTLSYSLPRHFVIPCCELSFLTIMPV